MPRSPRSPDIAFLAIELGLRRTSPTASAMSRPNRLWEVRPIEGDVSWSVGSAQRCASSATPGGAAESEVVRKMVPSLGSLIDEGRETLLSCRKRAPARRAGRHSPSPEWQLDATHAFKERHPPASLRSVLASRREENDPPGCSGVKSVFRSKLAIAWVTVLSVIGSSPNAARNFLAYPAIAATRADDVARVAFLHLAGEADLRLALRGPRRRSSKNSSSGRPQFRTPSAPCGGSGARRRAKRPGREVVGA